MIAQQGCSGAPFRLGACVCGNEGVGSAQAGQRRPRAVVGRRKSLLQARQPRLDDLQPRRERLAGGRRVLQRARERVKCPVRGRPRAPRLGRNRCASASDATAAAAVAAG